MNTYYNANGLMFWTEKEFRLRETFRDFFVSQMRQELRITNPAWNFFGVEAPIITPKEITNPNYTEEDIFVVSENQVLRPETTPGTYRVIQSLFSDTNSGVRPPVCVWQYGKSFRKEQDQVWKNMRLKEFYQLEFQCVYTSDSANEYGKVLAEPVRKMIQSIISLPTRIVESDRLPSYSKSTFDVECCFETPSLTSQHHSKPALPDKWMEVCSMSLRTDFPTKWKGPKKEHDLLVAEIAIGLDRCVYLFQNKNGEV